MDETPPTVVYDESASAKPVSSDKKEPRQRLVVCLDGSWNKRGSGTNIYHISNLVQKGKVTKNGKTWRQRVYYDEGVGTGILDRISGGAFGIGVSENVRQAYDWLVEKYNDGDEVYVFGFSRGAFTARSLVGLITKCGLVYRGAPVPQQQLWEGYRKLGSKPEWRDNNAADWAKLVKKREISFRPRKFYKKDDGTKVDPPGELAKPTEELLSNWSRRISITCLGIFDSVGTFGVEAVAIPWLQERRAQFHDTELSSCVLNGFHALAINEYRANFSHIPWRRPAGQRPGENIKQRWFIGAHTNIGGGCSDNALAQFPLKWMMDRCAELGLVFRQVKPELEDAVEKCIPLHPGPKDAKGKSIPGNVGDSFSEFMGGIWRYALRNKPNYRWIAPPLEFQHGQAVKSNEEVDPSVEKIIRADRDWAKGKPGQRKYQPPNLWAFWNLPKDDDKKSPGTEDKKILEKPEHVYLGDKAARWSTAGWLFGIAWAVLLIVYLAIGGWHPNWWFWLALAVPCVAFAADFAESLANHRLALDPRGDSAERRRSFYLDKLLNIRLFFLGASLVGVVFFLVSLVKWLSFCVPAWEVLWLFGLALIAVRLKASWDWSALPIAELGKRFGSWFYYEGYASRFAIPSAEPEDAKLPASKSNDLSAEVSEVRRSWKKRALLRDGFGFIPAAIIAIGFGWWLSLSLIFWPPAASSPAPCVWGGLNLDPRCWMPAALVSLLYAIFAIRENRRQASAVEDISLRRSSSSLTRAIFWLGIMGFLAAILGLAGLQFWRLFCKAVLAMARCMARLGWASGPNGEFTDLRIIPGDKNVLPEWLALVAAALAISCLWSAIKQKRSQESVNSA